MGRRKIEDATLKMGSERETNFSSHSRGRAGTYFEKGKRAALRLTEDGPRMGAEKSATGSS